MLVLAHQRRARTAIVLVAVTMLFAARPAAAKSKPQACPPGRFVQAAPVIAGGATPDVIVFSNGQLSIASGCPPARAHVKATRNGTKVAAKAKTCGTLKKVRIKATIVEDCDRLRGTLKAKGSAPLTIDARRTRCGDGLVDPGNNEACEPPSAGCTSDCLVDTTTTTLPSVCGDGVRTTGEECDDGNQSDTDACRTDCTLTGIDAGALAAATCAFRARCEPVLFDFNHDTLETCITKETAKTTPTFTVVRAAIAAGRAQFDSTAFAGCLTAFGTADCALGIGDACQFFSGLRTAGEGCNLTTECAPDLFCDAPNGGCGTCQPRGAAGDDCTAKVCIEGTTCLAVPDARCVPDTAGENAACGSIPTGLCRGRLQCVGTSNFTCQRPAAHGATCDATLESGPGCNLFLRDTCVSDVCTTVTLSIPGDSCATGALCDVDGQCNVATHECDALPAAGSPCALGNCAVGNFCDGATCAALRTAGGSCTSIGQCATGLLCLGAPGAKTCQAPAFTGCP